MDPEPFAAAAITGISLAMLCLVVALWPGGRDR